MTETSFAGLLCARKEEYKKFRLSYPSWLFEEILGAVPEGRKRVAVDLGSGTGLSLAPLVEHFEHVIAVEPDARMAEQIPKQRNLEVKVSTAESVEFPANSVDLITCGTAFYWMNGPLVLEHASRWLSQDGALAIFRYALPELPKAVAAILDREFREHWNEFRHPRLLDEEYSARVISESPVFSDKQVIVRPHYYEMDAGSFVGFFGSTSYVGAYLRSGKAHPDYLTLLREEIEESMGKNEFRVNFPTELILARLIG